jgi:hypothetical protein
MRAILRDDWTPELLEFGERGDIDILEAKKERVRLLMD